MVIEHFSSAESIFKEVARVLKTGGRFIVTTPRNTVESLIKIYAKNIDQEHVSYFDYDKMVKLTETILEIVSYHRFTFGLNQVFCFEKLKSSDFMNFEA